MKVSILFRIRGTLLHRLCVRALIALTLLHTTIPIKLYRCHAYEIITNSDYVEAVISNESGDPSTLFVSIFHCLPRTVTVYPSEGYFYYTYLHGADLYRGNIRIPITLLYEYDNPEISFYAERTGPSGVAGIVEDVYGQEDGVLITVRDKCIEISIDGHGVNFCVHDPSPYGNPELVSSDEEFLGVSLDESGEYFQLTYSRSLSHLYWILNPGPSFAPRNLTPSLYIDDRTGFIYWLASEPDRYILVGVHRRSAIENDWFDGPFDQLPDLAISRGDIDIRNYLTEFGVRWEQVDRYGIYVHDPDRRVAIANYMIYTSEEHIVRIVAALHDEYSGPELIAALTPVNF